MSSKPTNLSVHSPGERPLACIFLPSLAAGGAERVLIAIAGELANRGYRCDLVTADDPGIWSSRVPGNVRHVTLGHRRPLHAVPGLFRYLRQERPRVVLSSIFNANIAAIIASRMAGIPCVVREANRSLDDTRGRTWLGTMSNRWAMRLLYPRAGAVIALTKGLARHLLEMVSIPSHRVTIIPNPVLAGASGTLKAPRQGDDLLVLACGRLEPQKDHATLLRAFAIASSERPARLAVIGTGSLRRSLGALAEELGIASRVEFPGYVDDVAAWMNRASVFVLSSQWEGFPNVLLEALANSCVVVSTDSSDAVHEVLANGVHGDIVPKRQPEALANAIRKGLDAPRPGEDRAAHLARYRLDAIASRYLDVLLATAERKR